MRTADVGYDGNPEFRAVEAALEVAERAFETMKAQAEAAWPRECAGALVGAGGRILFAWPLRARWASAWGYEADELDLLRCYECAAQIHADVMGFYHSHPSGVLEPSPRDRAMWAWWLGRAYWHAIVAVRAVGVRFYQVRGLAWRPVGFACLCGRARGAGTGGCSEAGRLDRIRAGP
jgi:proteasome lid subunit RPN8/RPN11